MNIKTIGNTPNFKGQEVRLTASETAQISKDAKEWEGYLRNIPENIFVARSLDLYNQEASVKMSRQDTMSDIFITEEELTKRFKQNRVDLINGFRHLADSFHTDLLTDRVAQNYDKIVKMVQDGVKKVNPKIDLRLDSALAQIREDNIKKLTLDEMKKQYQDLENGANEALDGSEYLKSHFDEIA